jgi:hypothetical protein
LAGKSSKKEANTMPWSLRLCALSGVEPCRLLRFLSATIFANGGWILSRTHSDIGVEMSFEFERSGAVEIYTALVAAGLELSQDSHHSLTELCHCTRNLARPVVGETVGVELEVLAQNNKVRPMVFARKEVEIG